MSVKVMMHKAIISRRPYPPNHGRGGGGKSETARRGAVANFSAASHRRMDERLHSYDYERMIADGDSSCQHDQHPPRHSPDARECAEVFDAAFGMGGYLNTLCKQHGIQYHGVANWKREMTIFRGRNCPHWHAIVGADKPIPKGLIWQAWFRAARAYRPQRKGQKYSRVVEPIGLVEYTTKHTAKGVDNPQTAEENIPEQWRTPEGAPKKSVGRWWGDINKEFWRGYIVDAYTHDFTLKAEFKTARRRALRWLTAARRTELVARRCAAAAANAHSVDGVKKTVARKAGVVCAAADEAIAFPLPRSDSRLDCAFERAVGEFKKSLLFSFVHCADYPTRSCF